MEETVEDQKTLDAKTAELADIIRTSRKAVVHTGAGLSTSCGIPDFRGPKGVWTMRDKGEKVPRKPPYPVYPSKAHMAIKKLLDENVIDYVCSQNTDGLHVMSGIPFETISELHGNKNREICSNARCKKAYYRYFPCRRPGNKVHDHSTGRKCDKCNSELHDSIVNFGENLPKDDLESAEKYSKEADLCIVLGTSLKVTPAAELPLEGYPKCKLAIVNLQETPVDSKSHLRIYGKCDDVMISLMSHLGYEIPPFIARARLSFKMSCAKIITSKSNFPNLIQSIKLSRPSGSNITERRHFTWKYQGPTPAKLKATVNCNDRKRMEPLELSIHLSEGKTAEFIIEYNTHDPESRGWSVALDIDQLALEDKK